MGSGVRTRVSGYKVGYCFFRSVSFIIIIIVIIWDLPAMAWGKVGCWEGGRGEWGMVRGRWKGRRRGWGGGVERMMASKNK